MALYAFKLRLFFFFFLKYIIYNFFFFFPFSFTSCSVYINTHNAITCPSLSQKILLRTTLNNFLLNAFIFTRKSPVASCTIDYTLSFPFLHSNISRKIDLIVEKHENSIGLHVNFNYFNTICRVPLPYIKYICI